jgi:hypothetical protein
MITGGHGVLEFRVARTEMPGTYQCGKQNMAPNTLKETVRFIIFNILAHPFVSRDKSHTLWMICFSLSNI